MARLFDKGAAVLDLRGLILLGLIGFGSWLLWDFGFAAMVLEGDKSRLSYVILAIYLGLTVRWYILLRGVESGGAHLERGLNHGWLGADICLKLGLLGTIIGFILMLAPIRDLTSFDPESLRDALQAMSGGMAVALFTTLAGLVANLLLRLQYAFLADALDARDGS